MIVCYSYLVAFSQFVTKIVFSNWQLRTIHWHEMKATMYGFQPNIYANFNLLTVGLGVIYIFENVNSQDYQNL